MMRYSHFVSAAAASSAAAAAVCQPRKVLRRAGASVGLLLRVWLITTMAIELKKRQPYDLTKKAPGLSKILAGLSWDASAVDGVSADCDVSVFMLDSTNKVPGEKFFVFYNNLRSEDGSVQHMGDNRDGAGDGDDEVIEIDLSKVATEVAQILFAVTIHEAEQRGQDFGSVRNAAVRIVNKASGEEVCKFTLTEQFSNADSLVIGRLYRDQKEWKFEAMSEAFGGGLGALVELYT
jgi:tellurium resistance protein TerD